MILMNEDKRLIMRKISKKFESTFFQQIHLDIMMINNAIRRNDDIQNMYHTHLDIDTKYQPFIDEWGRSLYCWSDEFGFHYGDLETSNDMLEHNLRAMKSKLESLRFYFSEANNSNEQTPSKVTNIFNNKNNYYFDRVTNYVSNSYHESDKEEVLLKISEIEDILKSKDTREKKWSKLSQIGKWVFDRSVDVGLQLLPLFLDIK